ncbi:hypothetical protein [uncultured Murdochiella sp.]|uniref:hypothetical protein n=1 Tax=uncultured Murdochiella sp. TaxID=1586095 RepID=UPI002803A5A8|nr:hypothetical protein [uncultured Murdochiella sp.]
MPIFHPGKSRNRPFARGVSLCSTPGLRRKKRFARGACRFFTLASREIGHLPGILSFV